jgi:small GTP-binding protein
MSKKVIKGQNDKGSYDYLCKSIIVGDSAVGKTNIVLRFTEDTYKASHTATIGVDFKIKTLNIDGTKIKLQIWDTAGQCKFRNITRTYFKGAIAAIFAFSVTDRTSFENIGDWVRQSAESSDYTPIRILVGNKCDLKT